MIRELSLCRVIFMSDLQRVYVNIISEAIYVMQNIFGRVLEK